jgi:hypothetical protein
MAVLSRDTGVPGLAKFASGSSGVVSWEATVIINVGSKHALSYQELQYLADDAQKVSAVV